MPPTILGLGGLLSDPACCIVRNGQIASAVEQAKVSRQDRPGAFPQEAFAISLEVAGIAEQDIDCVAITRPFAAGPESTAQVELRSRFPKSEIIVVEHHYAHAASAYYASGFDSASVLSVDRAGDFRSAVLFRGEGNQLVPARELYFPDSLGDVFNRVTALLGFEPRADEHKVQWLSTSGEPKYSQLFWDLLHRGGSAWPQIDRSFLDSNQASRGGFSARFHEALEAPPETIKPELAASLQHAIEATVAQMLGKAENVCLAGGLGLNALLVCSLEKQYKNVFVQPAAGNAGTALGAALFAWHSFFGETSRIPFETVAMGPVYKPEAVKQVLENCKLRFKYLLTEGELIEQAVRVLNDDKILAWMQGRTEFGPRALGNRSILASPLNPYSTENLNVYIKHREKFRKFAASVPEEMASEYFEVGSNARYLATVGTVREKYRDRFSAAILGSDQVRVHTVRKEENRLYHALLVAAGKANGLPVLYNTSFNLFGDPLVCTPRDAVRSFYSSGIDALIVGGFYLEK